MGWETSRTGINTLLCIDRCLITGAGDRGGPLCLRLSRDRPLVDGVLLAQSLLLLIVFFYEPPSGQRWISVGGLALQQRVCQDCDHLQSGSFPRRPSDGCGRPIFCSGH